MKPHDNNNLGYDYSNPEIHNPNKNKKYSNFIVFKCWFKAFEKFLGGEKTPVNVVSSGDFEECSSPFKITNGTPGFVTIVPDILQYDLDYDYCTEVVDMLLSGDGNSESIDGDDIGDKSSDRKSAVQIAVLYNIIKYAYVAALLRLLHIDCQKVDINYIGSVRIITDKTFDIVYKAALSEYSEFKRSDVMNCYNKFDINLLTKAVSKSENKDKLYISPKVLSTLGFVNTKEECKDDKHGDFSLNIPDDLRSFLKGKTHNKADENHFEDELLNVRYNTMGEYCRNFIKRHQLAIKQHQNAIKRLSSVEGQNSEKEKDDTN